MKLNIQYLQQALRQDHPDVKTLAARVSASMLEQIENLSYIASEFSDFANIPEARPELIVLNELLDTAVSLYQQASDIDVVLVIPNEELLVFADHSQLLRVLTNLLQNAVQAIPTEDRKGMIEITLTKMDTMLRLAIRDNGRGIAPAVADRIFHPYFTTKSSGTGLGLAMTKKIIELSKGTIWFKSIAGEGTTFFIELPLADK